MVNRYKITSPKLNTLEHLAWLARVLDCPARDLDCLAVDLDYLAVAAAALETANAPNVVQV